MTSTNKKIRLLAFALVALAAAMTGCQKQDPASVVQRRAAAVLVLDKPRDRDRVARKDLGDARERAGPVLDEEPEVER